MSSIISIKNALFKPSLAKNIPAVYPKAIGLNIKSNETWACYGSGKTTMLKILSNKFYIPYPMASETFRYGAGIKNVKLFQFNSNIPINECLSTRYEHFKDSYFDQTCKQYISNPTGNNSRLYESIVDAFQIEELLDRWVMGLSNGQMRRARMAKVLLSKPDVLLIDEPFLGLDPATIKKVSKFFQEYSSKNNQLIIGMREQDELPEWISHVIGVEEDKGVIFHGSIQECYKQFHQLRDDMKKNELPTIELFNQEYHKKMQNCQRKEVPIFEMRNMTVSYSDSKVPVFENMNLKIHEGEKWHIQGANGTGKSTLLSLITADHPKSWNSHIWQDGQPRKSGRCNYFDINADIAMSSPELHAIYLQRGKEYSIEETLSSGLHDNSSNNFAPMWNKLDKLQQERITKIISELRLLSSTTKFGMLSTSEQKVILLARALLKNPRILILDEALSGMHSVHRDWALRQLAAWPGTMLAVAHCPEETPSCTHQIDLGIAKSN
ncbi:hypothetical protein TBLA_0A08720 [Henningerozyma blattae CBS 6284]|uniref:ABC transporter domain-containing protein n=1 Tax=Henningerozyma blattae (strain ATCC 34711 / CBS 6284 / DSM 70876 / NBRC 10599 / NRRL Y-10934 / UCD 77-7) TaxID=1071380 RepID=I2GX09_HENB6|nr:hypothetical protein TBLA_0A08720 [Tetrapisispora blattae CBS 6284]CCH58661.1 hypothetical protein TBLA_0A08720 [Tetrapisispora blattae CBS 6284]